MSSRFFITRKYPDTNLNTFLKEELEKQSGLKYPVFYSRKLVVIDGDPDASSIELCKNVLYSKFSETLTLEEAPDMCAVTILYRPGRTDTYADSIKAALSLNPYNSSVNVRTGVQYVFDSPLSSAQYYGALTFLGNALVYVPDGDAEQDGSTTPENRVAEGFDRLNYRELAEFKKAHNLKIDIDDMMCIQNHFLSESRDPTFAEIAVIDRFFGEDFRHTTFETVLDQIKIHDPLVHEAWERFKKRTKTKNTSLSGISKASKAYEAESVLPGIDEKRLRGIRIASDQGEFYVTFVGESRNRSVTVRPYDGAAAGSSEVHKGALSRLGSITDTYRICGTSDEGDFDARAILASNGFNEYSLAVGSPCTKSTRLVSSSYRDTQLEFCAALSVSKLNSLESLCESSASPGDIVYLVGARTGRDGSVCFEESASIGEFVAVTNPGIMNALTRVILRDDIRELASSVVYVGSGGIICAVGKLARGAIIHTDKIPAKHSGVSVEELLLSESAERMLICVSERDSKRFRDICHEENLPFAEIAEITDDDRIVASSLKEPREVSVKTDFLLSGGTKKHRGATVDAPPALPRSAPLAIAKAPLTRVGWFKRKFSKKVRPDLKNAFAESCKSIRFTADTEDSVCDSTVGGGIIITPFSEKTPDASVRALTYNGELLTVNGNRLCSVMAIGTNPSISRSNPFKGAYLAVTEALSKVVASGFGDTKLYIATQEYLPEYNDSSKQYGAALASLLGAYEAQTAFKLPSLGGKSAPGRVISKKESNGGSISFAIGVGEAKAPISRDFKAPGNAVVLFKPQTGENGLPSLDSQMDIFRSYNELVKAGRVMSSIAVNARSAASGIIEMCHVSGLGFEFDADRSIEAVFDNCYGSIIAELKHGTSLPRGAVFLGYVLESHKLTYKKRAYSVDTIFELAEVKPHMYKTKEALPASESVSDGSYAYAKPENPLLFDITPSDNYGSISPRSLEGIRVLIPVNNYYSVSVSDIREQFKNAGCMADVVSYSETAPSHLVRSIETADVIYFPDCLDRPVFAKAFFKLSEIRLALDTFRKKGGLIYGEGTGFELLLSSGLLELDEARLGISDNPDMRSACSTARIRVLSKVSPLMRQSNVGELYDTVITGKRLRLTADPNYLNELALEGRIASQVISSDNATSCTMGVEAISSKDGLVLGRLSHSLRLEGTEGYKILPTVKSIVGYFKNVKKQ